MVLKFLLLGIDGAQKNYFIKYKMPFFNSLTQVGEDLGLKADLISRGWVDIYTGVSGDTSGGLYEKPVCNGSYEWSKSCSLKDIKSSNSVVPIWEALTSKGVSVGVMNVPTTTPAPKLDKGFFVSGGGGGRTVEGQILDSQCSASWVKELLEEGGYILDERVPTLLHQKKMYKPSEMFSRLKDMTEKRISNYIKLYKKEPVDFGFLVIRSVAVVEYLARGEVDRFQNGEKDVNSDLVNEVYSFYEFLDEQLRRLYSEIKPEASMLISDHGITSKNYAVNFNELMKKGGFQSSDSRKGLLFEMKKLRHYMPYKLKERVKSWSVLKKKYQSLVPFRASGTKAFNITQMAAIYGVYVNDVKRFSGFISENEVDVVANEIIKYINDDKECQMHSIIARRNDYLGEKSYLYPDVIIDMPDGYYPSNLFSSFIVRNNAIDQAIDLSKVVDDNWTGTKSVDAMSLLIRGGNDLKIPSSSKYLKDSYSICMSYFD